MALEIGFDIPPSNAGDGRYVASICRSMDPAEFKPVFINYLHRSTDATPTSGLHSTTQTNDIPPRSCRFPNFLAPRSAALWLGFARTAHRLANQIRRSHIDLFHAQKCGCEEIPVAARIAGISQVLGTFHIDSTYDLHQSRNDFGHRMLEVISNWSLGAAISVSDSTKRDWTRRTGIPRERVITIHNGIDPQRFHRQVSKRNARRQLGLPPEACIVGAVGRLDEVKGLEYLIHAVQMLASHFPEMVLVIAGGGPLEESLKGHATRLGIMERVHILGFRSNIQLVLDALDIFAMPSLCETLGYALLEAMATELPAVGSRVGGIPEVIVPGETGLLVPPRDALALAKALRELLESDELRSRMGAAGRQRIVQYFNERDMVRRTLDVYRRLLAR